MNNRNNVLLTEARDVILLLRNQSNPFKSVDDRRLLHICPFYFAQHMCFLSVNFLINFNREQVNKQVIFTHFFSNQKTSDFFSVSLLVLHSIGQHIRYWIGVCCCLIYFD